MIDADFEDIWKKHQSDLESMAIDIQEEASTLAPVKTGKLSRSVDVRVSQSNRYPGIIAEAKAVDKRFDYSVVQETNETFSHEEGSAHYLGGPFARALQYWYQEATGRDIVLPPELEHAADYEGG